MDGPKLIYFFILLMSFKVSSGSLQDCQGLIGSLLALFSPPHGLSPVCMIQGLVDHVAFPNSRFFMVSQIKRAGCVTTLEGVSHVLNLGWSRKETAKILAAILFPLSSLVLASAFWTPRRTVLLVLKNKQWILILTLM